MKIECCYNCKNYTEECLKKNCDKCDKYEKKDGESMTEILPPMIKCNDCIFAKPFKDMFTGKIRFMCQNMEQIGEFGDMYSLIDTGCTDGIKKGTRLADLVP